MKDGAVEQCDTPDQIVLTSRYGICAQIHRRDRQSPGHHARTFAISEPRALERPCPADATVKQLAKLLVHDTREVIPVAEDGIIIGGDEASQMALHFCWKQTDGT